MWEPQFKNCRKRLQRGDFTDHSKIREAQHDRCAAERHIIVFINQSHSGGFCPSSGLIECEAKPQQALFADFLEGCK